MSVLSLYHSRDERMIIQGLAVERWREIQLNFVRLLAAVCIWMNARWRSELTCLYCNIILPSSDTAATCRAVGIYVFYHSKYSLSVPSHAVMFLKFIFLSEDFVHGNWMKHAWPVCFGSDCGSFTAAAEFTLLSYCSTDSRGFYCNGCYTWLLRLTRSSHY